MNLEGISLVLGLLFAGVGLILTGLGLLYAARQLRLDRSIAQAEFYLHLDELLVHHQETYLKLSPDPQGEWGNQVTGPKNVREWGDVVVYMGLFERIKILIDHRLVDTSVIKRLYSYRIQDIVNNRIIYQRMCVRHAKNWKDFNALCETLGIEPQDPSEVLADQVGA